VAEPLLGSRGQLLETINRKLASGNIPSIFEPLVDQTCVVLLAHLGDHDVIIGHNLFTLHKNLILTAAVHRLVGNNEGPAWVAWHHDFAWLRPQYQPELHPGTPWDLLRRPWPGVHHVTVSLAQRVDLARLYDISVHDITVVPPGVEPTEFYRVNSTISRLVAQCGLLESDCIFLLPARITRRKNIALALRWLAAVRERSGWDALLVVTGPPGPHNPTNNAYLENLLSMRMDLGLDKAAHFVYLASGTGRPLVLNDTEFVSLYQIADALFFTSHQEGFGIPILEAGLARLPIFATDLLPFYESAGSWATYFSADTTLPEVADTIITSLQTDRAFQLRRRVLTNHTWQHLVETRIVPLLRTVTAGNNGVS
jgi:glycosyltransferase involved in cell wall biosynthesis